MEALAPGPVVWDASQNMWSATVVGSDGRQKKIAWFPTAAQATTFSQFIQLQNSQATSGPATVAPPQRTIAVPPQPGNTPTPYESQLKALEKKLVPKSMSAPTTNQPNSYTARSNDISSHANLGLKLQKVRVGATNMPIEGYDSLLRQERKNLSPAVHRSSASRTRAKQSSNSAIEHLPVLPEWYRTTQAMTLLNLSRADVSAASNVPGNILSRFLNGNSHLPTHLDRLRVWLNGLNSPGIMTEEESVEMASIKQLTAIDIIPKTVRKRKRRSRRNIGRIGIQESFRHKKHNGINANREQEQMMLRQQQQAYYAERSRLLAKQSEEDHEKNHERGGKERDTKIYKLSCEIYGRNNDGCIAFNPKNATQSPMKFPMYTIPFGSNNVEIQLTEADVSHFKPPVSSRRRAKSQNSLQNRSSLLKSSRETDTSEQRVGADYQADLPPATEANECKDQGTLLWQPPTGAITDIGTYLASINARTSCQKEQALSILMGQGYKVKDAFAKLSNLTQTKSQWTSSDRASFEIAIDKHGRNFREISAMLSRNSSTVFTVKDCIRYYYDEFKLSKGYEIWKSNGKKNEDNFQQMNEALSSPKTVLDEDEMMVDGGNNTSHHHVCMECGGTGELLMCDRCPNVCHLYCNKPKPLTKVPLGQWFCHKCVILDRITARVSQYRQDRLSELDRYLPNPTAFEIYSQEHGNALKPEKAKRENEMVTDTDYDMLPRTTRLQYTAKANIAAENYRKAKLQIQTDVATFQRKLKRGFKDAEEKRGDVAINIKPTIPQHIKMNSVEEKWRKHRESEINTYIASHGPEYPASALDRFKEELMKQNGREKMNTCHSDARLLWDSLPEEKRASYDNSFQAELHGRYNLDLLKLKASTGYTEFVRVLDNEGKFQFFQNSQDGLAIQNKQSELYNLISNADSLNKTIDLTPQFHRIDVPQYQTQSFDSAGQENTWNSSQGNSIQSRPFYTTQGSNRFFFANESNAQTKQFVPPATARPEKSRLHASSILVRWEKKKRLLLKKYLRSKGVIHPGAPYVMYTAVQRNRAKTDPSIKEETLKAGWTKEVKQHYTQLFNKKLKAYRDARSHYENNMEDYKEYLKRVETVEKENFYRRVERQAQLQPPAAPSAGNLTKSIPPFLPKPNLAIQSDLTQKFDRVDNLKRTSNKAKNISPQTLRQWNSYRKKKLVQFEKKQGANRPGSAYILFTMDERAKHKASPQSTNLHCTDLAKLWANTTLEVKKHYEAKFLKLQQLYVRTIEELKKTDRHKNYVKYLDSTVKSEWEKKQGVHQANRMMTEPTNASFQLPKQQVVEGENAVTNHATRNRADTSRTSSTWKKMRQEKIRAFLRENGPKRPVAPFLMYYMEKAREARELAATNSSKRIPLDRTRLAEEFEHLPPEKKLVYTEVHDRNLASYHAQRDELLNSNRYMDFVHLLDTQGIESYNRSSNANAASRNSVELQHQTALNIPTAIEIHGEVLL